MSRSAPAIPLFGDAYIADTRHLSLEEHGAYLNLLMIAWRTEDCALPDDDVRLARMLGVTAKKWNALKPVVMAFWTLGATGWTQHRLTKERRFVAEKASQSRAAAELRWKDKPLKTKDAAHADADAPQMREPCGSDAPPPPPPQERKKEEDSTTTAIPTSRAGVDDGDGDFDLFGLTSRIANAAGCSIINPSKVTRAVDVVKGWLASEIDVDATILPVIAERLADMTEKETVGSLAFFDAAIRKRHALKAPKPKRTSPASRASVQAEDSPDDRVPAFRSSLKAAVGSQTYDAWLAPTRAAIRLNGSSVTIKAASAFARDWLIGNARDDIYLTAKIAFPNYDVRLEA